MDLQSVFQGPETPENWESREKALHQLQSLVGKKESAKDMVKNGLLKGLLGKKVDFLCQDCLLSPRSSLSLTALEVISCWVKNLEF